MKAFFIGLFTILAVAVIGLLGFLLMPLLLVLTVVLRIVLIGVLLLLGIWLLGRFIIYIWETLRKQVP
ncbi:hypothetical protein ACFL5X_01500 [Candidatus Omnitrophota bacterium]